VSLSVVKDNINPLHLQKVGTEVNDKKEEGGEEERYFIRNS
jgi:hypothetical protein